MSLSVHPLAATELTFAFEYYLGRSRPSASRFLVAVASVFGMLLTYPRAGRVVDGEIRGFPTRGFPYTVLYRIVQDELRIIAIHHQSQRPRTWRDRR